MKSFLSKSLILLHLMAIMPALAYCQEDFRAFKSGEWLKYRLSYGPVTAGYASLEVKNEAYRGYDVYHIMGNGWTVGMFKWFFRVEDRYETYIDQDQLLPHKFIRDVNEGGYKINRTLDFDLVNNTVVSSERDTIWHIEPMAHDMLSAFYFLRNIDTKELQVDQEIPLEIFMDHDIFFFKLKYKGREKVKTKFGKVWCLRFTPLVQSGRVFKEDEGVNLWISDDNNRIPILIQSDLRVGSIKVELNAYKGLKHTFKVEVGT